MLITVFSSKDKVRCSLSDQNENIFTCPGPSPGSFACHSNQSNQVVMITQLSTDQCILLIVCMVFLQFMLDICGLSFQTEQIMDACLWTLECIYIFIIYMNNIKHVTFIDSCNLDKKNPTLKIKWKDTLKIKWKTLQLKNFNCPTWLCPIKEGTAMWGSPTGTETWKKQ